MGHERVGVLPRTREWRALVQHIAATAESPEAVAEVAAAAIVRVRQRFEKIPSDPGFQAAFGFILALATTPRAPRDAEDIAPHLALDADHSALRLTLTMQCWVDERAASLEYADLAKHAAADVIAFWARERARQPELFASQQSLNDVWAPARNAGAFSDLCRVFFGKFTERYLKYFLDREASARLPTVEARERFAASIAQHIDALARHSFETTKIAQSFAAGWYNKHARDSRPDRPTTVAFLSFAIGKLRTELLREASAR